MSQQKGITVSTKILSNTTVLNIDNNKKCFQKHIRMIYEGSWDTEDWTTCNYISPLLIYGIFDEINAVKRRLSKTFLKM